MKRGLIFFIAYCALGSLFAPMTMRWLNSCHLYPIVKDCIIHCVMLTITSMSLAVAVYWRRER